MWGHTNLWIRSNLRIAWISAQHLSAQAELRPERLSGIRGLIFNEDRGHRVLIHHFLSKQLKKKIRPLEFCKTSYVCKCFHESWNYQFWIVMAVPFSIGFRYLFVALTTYSSYPPPPLYLVWILDQIFRIFRFSFCLSAVVCSKQLAVKSFNVFENRYGMFEWSKSSVFIRSKLSNIRQTKLVS